MKTESDNIHEYLKVTQIIDWDNRNVLAKAREIVKGIGDNITKIKCLFEWVRDEIPHSKDISSDIVSCTASEVLKAGTGICFAKSHLLAALLRANGIPLKVGIKCGLIFPINWRRKAHNIAIHQNSDSQRCCPCSLSESHGLIILCLKIQDRPYVLSVLRQL